MTKDVLLSIKGLQIGENEQNDTIEVISPGDYYFGMASIFLCMRKSWKVRKNLPET